MIFVVIPRASSFPCFINCGSQPLASFFANAGALYSSRQVSELVQGRGRRCCPHTQGCENSATSAVQVTSGSFLQTWHVCDEHDLLTSVKQSSAWLSDQAPSIMLTNDGQREFLRSRCNGSSSSIPPVSE
jgi:hypothetical protein